MIVTGASRGPLTIIGSMLISTWAYARAALSAITIRRSAAARNHLQYTRADRRAFHDARITTRGYDAAGPIATGGGGISGSAWIGGAGALSIDRLIAPLGEQGLPRRRARLPPSAR